VFGQRVLGVREIKGITTVSRALNIRDKSK
jgi:hypothetical protein